MSSDNADGGEEEAGEDLVLSRLPLRLGPSPLGRRMSEVVESAGEAGHSGVESVIGFENTRFVRTMPVAKEDTRFMIPIEGRPTGEAFLDIIDSSRSS